MLNNDTRYPYTYACDLIRSIAGYNKEGTKLSRSDAAQIREIFAKVTGLVDVYLAEKLADYYLAHREELEDKSFAEFNHEVVL